jgi:hypothetical protein
MRAFIQQYLDPAGRLGEVVFGLIMALGFTGAVRLGQQEAASRALFIGILGCNIAWAIVDGVMYVLTALFERGRQARLVRDIRTAASEPAALQLIRAELDGWLAALLAPDEHERLQRTVLAAAGRARPDWPRLSRDDLLGGVAVALVILLATLPIVVPYLLIRNAGVAVRLSNLIALSELFLVGAWWARVVGGHSLRIASGLTLVGVLLVLITIGLGG